MTIHLVNPSNHSFGVGAICPRWLYVMAKATPSRYGVPSLVDETLEPFDATRVSRGDIVGISVHTGNALRGYRIGTAAKRRGATVIFGGVHASLFADEACHFGGADAVVRGDGETIWSDVLEHAEAGTIKALYDGGQIGAREFLPGAWHLMPRNRYMFASVQTMRGCPKHCSFCSVWRTDGQRPRQRSAFDVIDEIQGLRRLGFRYILLADDNFYPVTLTDLTSTERRGDYATLAQLRQTRTERFALMRALSEMPGDMAFFTQITMEAASDPEFLSAMQDARIRGALVGVETVSSDGLRAIGKTFNETGEKLVNSLQQFERHRVHVLASFIFGLPTDTSETLHGACDMAERAGVTFAQFMMLTPFPGTSDYARWERSLPANRKDMARYWLIPLAKRPRVFIAHPSMSAEEIARRTSAAWSRFYRARTLWRRTGLFRSIQARIVFFVASKMFRRMFFVTGVATDSARIARSSWFVRQLAYICCRRFVARPQP